MGPKRSNKRPGVTRKTTKVQLPFPEFNPDAESPSKVKRRREEEKQESDPDLDEPKGLLSDIEDEFDDIISGTHPVNTIILDGFRFTIYFHGIRISFKFVLVINDKSHYSYF